MSQPAAVQMAPRNLIVLLNQLLHGIGCGGDFRFAAFFNRRSIRASAADFPLSLLSLEDAEITRPVLSIPSGFVV
jgi:hypothetical protein